MNNLREHYFEIARKSKSHIAIGIGNKPEMQKKCITAVRKAEELGIGNIVVVGSSLNNVKKELNGIEFYESNDPEEHLINLLRSKKIQGAVRGGLSAGKTIAVIKKLYGIDKLLRIGPIDVSRQRTFMLGPLGIDEGINLDEKIDLIKCMMSITEKLEIKPRIAVMSLGRNEDMGRNDTVDRSIYDAAGLMAYANKNRIMDVIYDTEILLENLDKIKANCILAPTGYIGNIMYRCLVHLGCGHSYGGYICGLPDAFIDTSRGGYVEEYITAIAMAKAGV